MLYETLPDETQEIFLQELFAKQGDKIKISAEKENSFLTDDHPHFQDLCGLLTVSESASAEDMQKAVLQRAKEEFNDCS
jgi:hypothetical protein